MSNDELMSTAEKRFLDDVLQQYNLLATEAKKKHPHVKEVGLFTFPNSLDSCSMFTIHFLRLVIGV